MPGIVVGVDGSDHSHRALIWAMRQAAQQHVPLTVLAVRPDPVRPVTGVYWGVHTYPEHAHNSEVARKAIQQIVEQAGNEIGETAPHVTVNLVTGIRPKSSSRHRATPTWSSRGPGVAAGSPHS